MMTLCRGAALYFAPKVEVLAGEFLDRVVARYGITHATLPPAVLAGMPEEVQLNSIRTMILAGEALAEPLAKRWASGRRLINAYGIHRMRHGVRIQRHETRFSAHWRADREHQRLHSGWARTACSNRSNR
jgi:hypothetical protein